MNLYFWVCGAGAMLRIYWYHTYSGALSRVYCLQEHLLKVSLMEAPFIYVCRRNDDTMFDWWCYNYLSWLVWGANFPMRISNYPKNKMYYLYSFCDVPEWNVYLIIKVRNELNCFEGQCHRIAIAAISTINTISKNCMEAIFYK